MGPVFVVVLDVVDDEAFELSLVPDDGAIEELAADRSDPSFSERVGHRSPDGCLEGLEAVGPNTRPCALAWGFVCRCSSSASAFGWREGPVCMQIC